MPQQELNLWDYWRIIRKRRLVIIGVALIVILSTFFYSYRQIPIYEASTTIRILSRSPIVTVSGSGIMFQGPQSEVESEIELIKGDKVLRRVAKNLRYIDEGAPEPDIQMVISRLRGKINTEQVEYTDLIEITTQDSNPLEAMRIVMEVAYSYIEENWLTKINEAKTTREFIEQQLHITEDKLKKTENYLKELKEKGEAVGTVMPLQEKMTQLESRLSALTEKYTDNHPEVIKIREEIKILQEQLKWLAEKELLFTQLTRELKTNEELYSMLKDQYAKAQISEASKTKDVEIVNPAVEPRFPISPNRTNNLFLGSIIGIILGLVAAVITESLDTSIGTIEDVEEYLKLSVLGVIPYIKIKQENGDIWKKAKPEDKETHELISRLIVQYQPKSSIAEAYRSLQTNLEFTGLQKAGNSFIFTSVGAGEGKTITTTNCAISFAQMGKKVLLVDGDLRRPSIHKIFGIGRESGLNEVLVGSLKLDEAFKTINDILLGEIKASEILKTHGIENLTILTCGHLPTNPSELLSSRKMAEIIKEVKGRFDIVLFDCAPVLPVTDAVILGAQVDAAVLVYQAGRVARGALKRAKIQLETAKVNPIGVVLNNIRASEMETGYPYYYYHYKRYYGAGTEEEGKQ